MRRCINRSLSLYRVSLSLSQPKSATRCPCRQLHLVVVSRQRPEVVRRHLTTSSSTIPSIYYDWLHGQRRSLHQKPSPKGDRKEEDDTTASSLQKPPAVDPATKAAYLRESIWTVPNLITISRITCSPILSYWILQGDHKKAVAGLAVAAFTDWLDGYIAKNYNQTSVLGTFLDPVADKVLVATLSIPLAMQGHLPPLLVFIMFGRDALLVTGAFIMRARSRPAGSGFFDTTSSATFKITPTTFSKGNTVLQFSTLVLSLLRAAGLGFPPDDVFDALCITTGATTIISGLGYLKGDGTSKLNILQKIRRKKKDDTTTSAGSSGGVGPPSQQKQSSSLSSTSTTSEPPSGRGEK